MKKKIRYVQDGNTIRKVYEFPEIRPDKKEHNEREPHKQTYRHTEKVHKMSFRMTLLLAVSVVVSVLGCIRYLDARADIDESKQAIERLEKSIDTLSTKNDAIQYEIDGYVDIEYILKTAMEELGMVIADESQVITYDSTRNEYMEQYSDVP